MLSKVAWMSGAGGGSGPATRAVESVSASDGTGWTLTTP